MSRTYHLFLWLAGLLVLVGVFFAFSYFFNGASSISLYPDIAQINQAKFAKDKTIALNLYNEIKTDPARSSDEKALADVEISGVEFIATGDIKARVTEIQNLKKAYLDQSVSPAVRAAALTVLGREYSLSGGNPAILNEVYKDAPFNSYFVPGSPGLSEINIEKAAYAIYPTTVAAIAVASTASGLDFLKGTSSSTAAHIALAEEYLKKADAASIQDSKDNPTYIDSDRYMTYSAGRAYTLGRLAILKGEPYESSYRNAYDTLIIPLKSKQRPLPNELLLNVRFQYARVLAVDHHPVGEKQQLDQIAKLLNGITNPDVYSLVQSLRNEKEYRPTGQLWGEVQRMFGVSPDFKAAVTKVLTVSSK